MWSSFSAIATSKNISKRSNSNVSDRDDPNNPGLDQDLPPQSWWSVTGNIQLDQNHDVTVFAGERRRGTACTSGTCYEVPDFSGVEIRVTSRF